MKTPEKIKKGMKLCKPIWKGDHWKTCDEKCPYRNEGSLCREMLNTDALALIQQLEAENAELKRERDAAVNELKLGYACFACRYFFRNGGTCKGGSTCMKRSESCSVFGAEYSGLYFKWRGPCEENGGGEKNADHTICT